MSSGVPALQGGAEVGAGVLARLAEEGWPLLLMQMCGRDAVFGRLPVFFL